jgi:hypothetical protein
LKIAFEEDDQKLLHPQKRENKPRTRLFFENKSSKYKNVFWDKNMKKWKSRIILDGEEILIGFFDCDEVAAIFVNRKCRELGIPLRNPDIEFYPNIGHDEIRNDKEPVNYLKRKRDQDVDRFLPVFRDEYLKKEVPSYRTRF